MQLPLGKGIWPAFWMLGDDIGTAGWPKAGEIDIMENIGEAGRVYSTLHGPGYSGDHGISGEVSFACWRGCEYWLSCVHMRLSGRRIIFGFISDDKLIAERTPADLPAGAKWVYDHPFFVILNLAVGRGLGSGYPDETTVFPQRMLVDYVRVYEQRQGSGSVAVGG